MADMWRITVERVEYNISPEGCEEVGPKWGARAIKEAGVEPETFAMDVANLVEKCINYYYLGEQIEVLR